MQVKVQWTEQLVAQQRQKTEKIRKETDLQLALLDAEREKQVLAIELEAAFLALAWAVVVSWRAATTPVVSWVSLRPTHSRDRDSQELSHPVIMRVVMRLAPWR